MALSSSAGGSIIPNLNEPVYNFEKELGSPYSFQYFSYSKDPAPSVAAVKEAWPLSNSGSTSH